MCKNCLTRRKEAKKVIANYKIDKKKFINQLNQTKSPISRWEIKNWKRINKKITKKLLMITLGRNKDLL